MPEKVLKEAAEKMDKAVGVTEHQLATLRTGRATPALLEGITVELYGTDSPINQVATVSTPDASLITVQPWDRNALAPIEKAILQANIGLTPSNDGKIIRLQVPQLTEDRRKEIVKQAHGVAEEGRVSVRNIRRHINDDIKKKEKAHELSEDESKRLHDQVQKLTDDHIKKIDDALAHKEKEILTV